MRTELFCYAKLNLTLSITGVLQNGYHNLVMHNASVGVCDRISVWESKGISCTMDGVMASRENTAYRAAALCAEAFGLDGLSVDIKKGIPFGAGMGGSSADAAAVFSAVSNMFGVCVPNTLAMKVGADVPYMMQGGACRVEGIGEVVLPGKLPVCLYAAVIVADSVSTAQAFAAFDRAPYFCSSIPCLFDMPIEQWKSIQPQNALYNGVRVMHPSVEQALCYLQKQSPLFAGMTGSGGAVFGLYDRKEEAKRVIDGVAGVYPYSAVLPIVEKGIEFC